MTCKNCKFFVQHYALNQKGFSRVFCGHCIEKSISSSLRNKTSPEHKICEFFEALNEVNELQKKENQAIDCLKKIEKQLADISDYLQINRKL